MRRAFTRVTVVVTTLLGAILLLVALPVAASAHPLGNFTVNSFDALRVQTDRVLVDHVTDRAEIPTQQLTFASDPIARTATPEAKRAWSTRACKVIVGQLTLTVDGRTVPLEVDSEAIGFPDGAGGLPTSRLTCRLSTSERVTIRKDTPLAFRDGSDNGRVGWHEIIALGDGTTLSGSDVPSSSVSRALTAYPQDLLSSPLTTTSATLRASAGGADAPDPLAGTDAPRSKEQSRGVDRLSVAFTDLVGKPQLSIGIGALAILLALVLGAFHAFAPGHGKTVMAAYLIADRGNLRQVVLIGLAVTATHTLGVLILGLLLSTYATFAPESVYPWLGVASGLLLLTIGWSLLRGAWERRTIWGGVALADHEHDAPELEHGHDHGHGHDHPHGGHDHHDHDDHDHDDHDHSHGHDDHGHDDHGHSPGHDHDHDHDHGPGAHPTPAPVPVGGLATLERPAGVPTQALVHRHGGRLHTHAPLDPEQPIKMRNLLSMGLAGGLVPSPSAVVVLIAAITLGRAWFGVLLVVFYGLGMALTLVGIGLLLARLRGRVVKRLRLGGGAARAFSILPLATAAVICGVGLFLVARGLGQL